MTQLLQEKTESERILSEGFMTSEEFRKRGKEKIDNICRKYGLLQ